ncbi:sensor histidine kinase [Pedobacter rhodius]|uniref:Histidine kinase n=1 Tax=Pedobacter rhodius TaxID=3004098 RepID=A0ABT4KVR1_9SPHI|nr:histidine kinase [Pedobacter sp. SJ11]MCZ4222929.1 histidine kinase [Pedobacter sp. SJ11]
MIKRKIFSSAGLRKKPGKRFAELFAFLMPALIWILLLIIPLLGNDSAAKEIPGGSHNHLLLMHLLLIFICYFHNYLFKRRRSKQGMFIYLSGILACFLVFVLFRYVMVQSEPQVYLYAQGEQGQRRLLRPPLFFMIVPFFVVLAIGFAYSSYMENVRLEQLNKEKENIYLKTELDFLSSQVSPHFMFNVLNTLVGMARKKSDELEPALINLSGLLRYMLNTTNNKTISLADEIEYLQGYIALQMLRFGSDLNIKFKLEGNFSAFAIQPMLLIPLVENAFKHGIGMDNENQFIDIDVKIDGETRIFEMSVMNFVSSHGSNAIKESGIGLPNLKRRLQLLYPKSHEFEVTAHENTFLARLELKL